MKMTEYIKTAKTPQEALLFLAEAVDNIRAYVAGLPTATAADPWQQPLAWDNTPGTIVVNQPNDNRARFENGDVIVDPVSPDRQEARANFAGLYRLHEFYGSGLSELDFRDAYVKGGPRWLYYTNRDAVMLMPMELRRELVADVLLDSPSEADEIGRDILKFDESMPEAAQLEGQRARLGKP